MQELYKNTFDKISMDAAASEKIRRTIDSAGPQKTPGYFKVMIAVAAAAAVIAALMLIPPTRALAVSAAQSISRIFGFANGQKVVITESENETAAAAEDIWDFGTYLKNENGRLIFSFDGQNLDITDRVSATEYFRYEKSLEDGSMAVILAGGSSPETWGWAELIFDNKGNYVMNRMAVPVITTHANPDTEEWVNIAMHAEGVPCGDPYLDDQLKQTDP